MGREYSNGGEMRNGYKFVIGGPERGRRNNMGCLGALGVSY